MSLSLANNSIVGSISGKPVRCSIRLPRGSGLPGGGEYTLHSPVQDPVYGWTALLTVSRSGPSQIADTMVKADLSPSKAMGKVDFSPASAKFVGKPAPKAAIGKFAAAKAAELPSSSEQVFVLSERPIPGRNCLVLTSGFADLIEALKSAGGSKLVIS